MKQTTTNTIRKYQVIYSDKFGAPGRKTVEAEGVWMAAAKVQQQFKQAGEVIGIVKVVKL